MAILQVGAGGVGWVLAHKLAQNNDVFGDIVLASRTVAKANRIIESIHHKKSAKLAERTIAARELNADDIPLTHTVLAQLLGVRRAGVTECLERFERAGLIDNRRGQIRICKPPSSKGCESTMVRGRVIFFPSVLPITLSRC